MKRYNIDCKGLPFEGAEGVWVYHVDHVSTLSANASMPAPLAAAINQCDGCQRGLAVENGIHKDDQRFGMMCTKSLYTSPQQTAPAVAKDSAAPAAQVAPSGQDECIAPVQGFTAGIPWSMHLEAYDAYCKKYSRQPAMIDPAKNCRGGFHVNELDMFIPGWRDRVSEIGKLKTEIVRLCKYNAELEAWQDKARDASALIAENEQLRRRLGEKDVTPIAPTSPEASLPSDQVAGDKS